MVTHMRTCGGGSSPYSVHSISWRDMRTGQLETSAEDGSPWQTRGSQDIFQQPGTWEFGEGGEGVPSATGWASFVLYFFLGVGGVQPGASAPPDDPLMSGELQKVHIHMSQGTLKSSFQALCQTLQKLKTNKHREVWAGTVVQT